MRTMISLAAVVALTTSAASAADLYLSDLLGRPTYRSSFQRLISASPPPGWITVYARTKNGPEQPVEDVKIGSGAYYFAEVCKPHDCADNKLQVLFDDFGSHAWGRIKEGPKVKWIGQPPVAVQQAIAKHPIASD